MGDNVGYSAKSYTIIGEIRNALLSNTVDQKNHLVNATGSLDDIFYGTPGGQPTPIVENESAFIIKNTKPDGEVISAFTAMVISVEQYSVDSQGQVKLSFHYLDISGFNSFPAELPEIPPVPVFIHVQDDYFAALYVGDEDYIVRYINDRMPVFRHGYKMYHSLGTYVREISIEEGNEERTYKNGVLLLACTRPFPDRKKLYEHYVRFCKLANIPNTSTEDEFINGGAK